MRAFLTVALLWGAAPLAVAQNSGQAELSMQGYYLGTAPRPVSATSGAAVKFQEFLPKFGLFSGSFEGYRSEGDLHSGDTFLEARGLRWRGMHWAVTGGDFRTAGSVLPNPFLNIYLPEVSGRGVKIEAGNSVRQYTFFVGRETIQAGPRIPFRAFVPQKTVGMAVRQKFGRLETGVRWLHLSSSPKDIRENPGYFPQGRAFTSVDNLTGYSTIRLTENLRWYGEATVARSSTLTGRSGGGPFSFFFGPTYETPRLTFRLNYANLSNTYLPIAGYLAGDRKGPFAELRVKPLKWVELFASSNRYESAAWRERETPSIRTQGNSAGLSFQLPLGFNASGQFSTIRLMSFDRKADTSQRSDNRQWTGTISKNILHQSLRFTMRELKSNYNEAPSRQKSQEIEDIVQFRRFAVGAAVRKQQSITSERRDSVFVRGTAHVNLGRLSAFTNFETGKDMVNQTLFATNLVSTTVIGANLRLSRKWNASAEAFRTRLISELNPASEFLHSSQGLAVDPVLGRFKQWSVLVKISRTFSWGPALPSRDFDKFAVKAMPLTGSITGFVKVMMGDTLQPVPDVAVSLESGRTVTTDKSGRYLFEEVPEGIHEIRLNLDKLPADYNPGKNAKQNITVGPRKTVRVDLDVQSLSGLQGAVVAKEGSNFETLENILIRLGPGGRYTTTLPDGTFAFHNLPTGDYEVEVDKQTLPPQSKLLDEFKRNVSVRNGAMPPPVRFDIERVAAPVKPTRKVLEIQIGPGKLSR